MIFKINTKINNEQKFKNWKNEFEGARLIGENLNFELKLIKYLYFSGDKNFNKSIGKGKIWNNK